MENVQPKLRFPEFNDKVQINLIENICEVSTGNKDTQNKVENGEFPFFVRSNNIERINSFSYDGEAVLTSGDGVGVGKNFHYINGKFDYHQRVYCMNKFRDVHAKYFYFQFSNSFYKRVMRMNAKNSVDSVRRDMITKMEIYCPSLPEQTKIADFLGAVDKQLELLTTKKEKLKLYKKGIMQKLFSQEIRFTKEDGTNYPDWEEYKLKDVVNFYNNLRIPLKDSERNNLEKIYPYYGASGIIDYVDKYLFDGEFILLGEDGANILTRSSRLSYLAKGKFWVNNHAHVFKAKNSFNNYFICEYLETLDYSKYNSGTAQPKLNSKAVSQIKISAPSLEEQTKIADFLTAIDNQIDAIDNQITKTENYKKGLLQQMFV